MLPESCLSLCFDQCLEVSILQSFLWTNDDIDKNGFIEKFEVKKVKTNKGAVSANAVRVAIYPRFP